MVRRLVKTVGGTAIVVGCGLVIALRMAGVPTPFATIVGSTVLLFMSRPFRAQRHS